MRRETPRRIFLYGKIDFFLKVCYTVIKSKRGRETMLDCAVVGTGIAGISARFNVESQRKNFALLGTADLSIKNKRVPNVF